MIDRLLQTALPLPPRPVTQDSQPGAPSFLEWALSNPGEASGRLPGGQSDPGGQHGQPGQLAPETAIPTDMIDPVPTLLSPDVLDHAAATLLPRNVPAHPLPAHPSQTHLPIRTPGASDPTHSVPHGLAPNGTAPGEAAFAVSAVSSLQDAETHVLQLHVRKPQGEREIVSMPWRLVPGGRLDHSLRSAIALAPGAVSSSTAGGAGPSMADAGLPLAGASGRWQNPSLPQGALASGEAALPPGGARIAARGVDAVGAAAVGAASAPVVSEWLSRWMKWIERDGHDPVVLLRDYRMDGDETRRVVDSLREFAREHGVSIERVVVNGHEFWRNPDSRPHSDRTEE
jgi:hypothetical protein